jgi:hypothetical protein
MNIEKNSEIILIRETEEHGEKSVTMPFFHHKSHME